MPQINKEKITIQPLQDQLQAEICARMMAESEPWMTLKRDYVGALEIIKDPDREVFLAVLQGEVLGFIILVMHGALVGYIQSICTTPEFRGKGLGSMLLEFAEERIFREHPNVFIMVSSFNPDARRLYERRGYKVVGKLENYIISGAAEYLLRKTTGPMKPDL